MRATSAILAGLGLMAALGCSRIQHRYVPYHAAGQALPVEVVVPHKPDVPVRGTVYHRFPGQGHYASTPLQARGGQLWALLPTESVPPDGAVEYYIDVTRDGKLIAMGSPAAPYVVTFLDEIGLILANLEHRVVASDTIHPVQIILLTGRGAVDQPTACYQMPGVPGDIRAPMEPDGRGNFSITIPSRAVSPGTWRYAIEVPVAGQMHRLPPQGYQSFMVCEPPPEALTVEVPLMPGVTR